MTREHLTELQTGRNLDMLMTIDPRGYGVSNILYDAARARSNGPLSTGMAGALIEALPPDGLVYIITGFVLLEHQKAEMDGIVGSVMLARALIRALGAKPALIVPEDCADVMHRLAAIAGLHAYDSIEEAANYPLSLAVIPFAKDNEAARRQTEALMSAHTAAAAIAVEAPGANGRGVYHNARGRDVSALEAKSDMLFSELKRAGVKTFAIGDLGNEMGMGGIGLQISNYVPGGAACDCGCGGGILAASSADHIIVATVSDWGCHALAAALFFMSGRPDMLHSSEMLRRAVYAASEGGMVDMSGELNPAVDGFDVGVIAALLELMRECINHPRQTAERNTRNYEAVLSLGYFDDRRNDEAGAE